MNRTEIYEAVNEIFQDVFDDDTLNVTAETTSAKGLFLPLRILVTVFLFSI